MTPASRDDKPAQSASAEGTAESGKPGMRLPALSLAAKLNLIVITAIIAMSTGLVAIGFRVNSDNVDEMYLDRVNTTVQASMQFIDPPAIAFLWENMQSEEFEQARQQALEQNDPAPLKRWMASIDASSLRSIEETGHNGSGHVIPVYGSLANIFHIHATMLEGLQRGCNVTWVYLQFEKDGVTYNLIDPEFGVLGLGSTENPSPEFERYSDNEAIPPTVFNTDEYGSFCLAIEPIMNDGTNDIVATLCVEADMTDANEDRYEFLFESIQYVLLVTLIIMAASLYLIRRIVTRPLHQLTEATCDFYRHDQEHDAGDIMQLSIRSRDEIGDLYHEIRSMQERITGYTRDMARISAEEERAKTELRMANSIQESMIPNVFPAFPDFTEFDVHATMDPAKDVGGDFYDFFLVDEGHLALVIADVSGKGVPAALFMMAVMIMIADRAQAGGSPAQVLKSVNDQICANNKTKTFVTVWMGILDIKTGIVTCANAGHTYPMLKGASGLFRTLRDKHSLVIGGSRKAQFKDYTVELRPGDAIFLYTDGVTEAVNPAHEFYGIERLEAALNAGTAAGPEEIVNTVRADVGVFADGAEKFDDLTMLCLRYNGTGPEGGANGPANNDEAARREGTITLPAAIESIPAAIDFVCKELETVRCPPKTATQITVAVDEILSNIAKFAYGENPGDVTVRFSALRDDVVEIAFEDQGEPYNPLEAVDPDITLGANERRVGGLGVFIVKKTMSEVEYERKGDRNILRIRKIMSE